MVARSCAPPAGSWLAFWRSLSGRLRKLHRILQRRMMGLHTCDIASVDVVALRPSWRCVDGATSHRYEAEMKTTFTLHEVCLNVAPGHLRKHLVLSGGRHEVLPFLKVCLACAFACTLSEIKVTATLDIVMLFCVSGDSIWQLACCNGGAWEWLRHVFDCMFWSSAVSTAWIADPSGGKLCWRSCSSQGVWCNLPSRWPCGCLFCVHEAQAAPLSWHALAPSCYARKTGITR